MTHSTDHSITVRSGYTRMQTREALMTVYCSCIDNVEPEEFERIRMELAITGELIKALRDADPEGFIEPDIQ